MREFIRKWLGVNDTDTRLSQLEKLLIDEGYIRDDLFAATKKYKGISKCPTMNKYKFTREQAKEAQERRTKKDRPLRIYLCEFCGYWHLTHQKNKMTMH